MTYSIVARDAAARETGAAIASHVPGIGARSVWAKPGVGVVVTQANFAVHYGPDMLSRMADGTGVSEALAALVSKDAMAPTRQVAAINIEGEVAIHSGAHCVRHANAVRGPDYACQANMLLNERGPEAMTTAFLALPDAPLAKRLLAALDAAEATGGDIRGRQAASMLIVADTTDGWAGGWLLDLRVDDHPAPLAELRRLAEVGEAMRLGGDEGARRYFELGNGNPEGWFFRGVELARHGDLEAAHAALERAYAVSENWRELLRRMPFMVASDEARERLLN